MVAGFWGGGCGDAMVRGSGWWTSVRGRAVRGPGRAKSGVCLCVLRVWFAVFRCAVLSIVVPCAPVWSRRVQEVKYI